MGKTKEEPEQLKDEIEKLNNEIAELTEEEIIQVSGGYASHLVLKHSRKQHSFETVE